MKIPPMVAEFFHADGQTGRHDKARRSWIRASWYDYESNQQDAIIQVNLLFL